MTPTAKKLHEAVSSANKTLVKYQTRCRHKNKHKEYGSNVGNYDPSCDRYWVD